MAIGILPFSCLAVLAAATIALAESQSGSFPPTIGVLAGENIPVYTADRPHPDQPIVYTKLETGTNMHIEAERISSTRKSSDPNLARRTLLVATSMRGARMAQEKLSQLLARSC